MKALTLGARAAVTIATLTLGVYLGGCGGGGNGGEDGGSDTGPATTFTGNLEDSLGPLASTALRAGIAGDDEVSVCVLDTDFCTVVAPDGTFTLRADVGGDVMLLILAPGFAAQIELTDVPRGATVHLRNIRCSVVTGICEPEDIDVEDGDETRGRVRCTNGPISITRDGALIIEGGGKSCLEAEGNCQLSIEADRIELRDCEDCVRVGGTADVTLTARAGGLSCTAASHGIRAAGNATVEIVAAPGDIVIDAAEEGISVEGTSLVSLETPGLCRIEGDEGAIRRRGNAELDISGCGDVTLVGDDEDDDDDEDDEDDDD